MAAEDIARNHIQAFNDHDAGAWSSHYAENAVLYDPQYAEPVRGRDAVQKDIEDFFAAFPDMQFNITSIVASGDTVAVEGVGSGTHLGPMEGPTGTVQPTNKRAEVRFASFMRTDNQGAILEERRYYDLAGMMMQLGLMPST